MRKFFIFLIALVLLGSAGAGGYLLYQKFSKKEPVSAPKPEVIVSEKVRSPILSFDGQKIWYLKESGKLFRRFIDTGVEEEYPLPEALSGAQEIIWQEEGSNFIVREQNRDRFYDFAKNSFTNYPKEQSETAFLEKQNKVVYIWSSAPGRFELKTSSYDGQNFEKIMDLPRPDYQLIVDPQNRGVLLLAKKSSGGPEQALWLDLASRQGRTLKLSSGFIGAKFSHSGDKLAVVYLDKLEITNILGQNPSIATLNFENPGQIVWGQTGSHIMAATGDGIFKIDTKTMTVEKVTAVDMSALSPTNLLYHPSQNLLFFIDQNSGFLHKVSF